MQLDFVLCRHGRPNGIRHSLIIEIAECGAFHFNHHAESLLTIDF